MPSDEPLLFYKLLLRGVAARPGLGQAGLLALQRGAGATVPAAAIEDESDASSVNHSTSTTKT